VSFRWGAGGAGGAGESSMVYRIESALSEFDKTVRVTGAKMAPFLKKLTASSITLFDSPVLIIKSE